MPDPNAARRHIEALRRDYRDRLPGRVGEVAAAVAAVRDATDPDAAVAAMTALHHLAHKLAGSAATYGAKAVGEAARRLERLTQGAVPPAAVLDDAMAALNETVAMNAPDAGGRLAVEAAAAGPPGSVGAISADSRILVVEHGGSLAGMAADLTNFGFSARGIADLASLAEALAAGPASVVVADPGPDHGLTREAVAAARAAGALTGPLIVVSSRGDLAARLDAVRLGCDAFIKAPATIGDLADALERFMVPAAADPYQVLVVDDDPAMARLIDAVLRNAGMVTAVVTDPLTITAALEDFTPELILMDLYMPGCDGQELAAVIRQQEAFAGVPIVFLSGESDRGKQLGAMGRGGDDFLTKPVRGDHLIAAVRTRAERFRYLRGLMIRDGLTGLLNHTATLQFLDKELARARRQGRPVAMAMMDIDHFKMVNDSHGHPVGDRVIRSLSRLLKQQLRGNDVIGRMGGEEFAAVIQVGAVEEAVLVFERIRRAFADTRHRGGSGEFTATLSCGVALSSGTGTVATLCEAADKALYAAKAGGRNRVVLADGSTH